MGGDTDAARLVGVVLAVLLAIGAIVAAVTVLGGGHDGEEASSKLLFSTFLLAGTFLVFGAGISLAGRRAPLPLVGAAVAALATIAFALAARNIWDDKLYGDWDLAGSFLLIALGAGQVALLLRWREREGPEAPWARICDGTIVVIALLVLLGVIEIAGSGDPIGPKPFGLLSILYMLGLGSLAVLALVGWSARRPGASPAEPSPGSAAATGPHSDHVVVGVEDWERSGAFYRDILGTDARPGYAAVSIAWRGTPDSAMTRLTSRGVEIVSGPTPREGAGGLGTSFYVRDPAGRLVELIVYPD